MISQSVNVVDLHLLSVPCGTVRWSTSLVHSPLLFYQRPGYRACEAQVIKFRLELRNIMHYSCADAFNPTVTSTPSNPMGVRTRVCVCA